jgi:GNAT superfamily N-acetyltransferase
VLWQVRAVVKDRPGAVAALAASFGAAGVNILALDVLPTGGGCVVDELVLDSPDGWTAADVQRLCAAAGVVSVVVRRASSRVLEDQPVRWLRAARLLLTEPDRLEEQLCSLLDAVTVAASQQAGLALVEGDGPVVRLARDVDFTDTEVGRATELRRVAAGAAGGDVGRPDEEQAAHPRPERPRLPAQAPQPPPMTPPMTRPGPSRHQRARRPEVVVRGGSAADAQALVAMHERCSAEVLRRRYLAPVTGLTLRRAEALLEPAEGRSVVVLEGDELVGAGLVTPLGDRRELALHVEDDRQRRGYGARLLRALAVEAAVLDWEEVTCVAQPGDSAVLSTVRRAGLLALVSYVDGTCHYTLPLARLRDAVRADASRAAAGGPPASAPGHLDDLVAQPAGG